MFLLLSTSPIFPCDFVMRSKSLYEMLKPMALAKQKDLCNVQQLRKIKFFPLGEGRRCSDLIDAFPHMQKTDKIDLDINFSHWQKHKTNVT